MSEDAEPQLIVVGGKRGRPRGTVRATEPGSTLSIYLPASEHEFYAKLAEKRGETVSSTVRALLRVKWKHSKDFGVK